MESYLDSCYDLNSPEIVSVLDEVNLWSAPFGLTLLESIRFSKGINALDIGSGTGFPLLELAQRMGSSCNIWGIDPWQVAIKRVQQKIEILKLKNVKILEGFAEQLPFEDDFFGLVVSNNGINNVADSQKVLTECYRVCKKDAQFAMTVNLPKTMYEFYSVFEAVLIEMNFAEEAKKIATHIHSKRKSIEETTTMLQKAGFAINDIKEREFAYTFADGSAMYNYFFIKLAFLDSWKQIVAPDQREKVFLSIEKQLNQIASTEGKLKLSIPYACFDCIKG